MLGWGRELGVTACLLATAGFAAGSAHWANRALEERIVEATPSGDVGALPDGRALRVLSLGFDRLIADLFWLRTLYYVGDERTHLAGYPAVDRLAELVTDIDPSFQTVYVVMSSAIGLLKGDADAAIEFLLKGTRNVEYWKLHYLLGYYYFLEKLDYLSAAHHIQIAAEMDGGPVYLPMLASRLYASGGRTEMALAFIAARLEEEKFPSVREELERRLRDLRIKYDVEKIGAAIEAFRVRESREPESVQALVTAGLLEREPRDPEGGRYRIEQGRVVSDLAHDQLEMHHATRPMSEIRGRPRAQQEGREP